jgi:hypothetical protein
VTHYSVSHEYLGDLTKIMIDGDDRIATRATPTIRILDKSTRCVGTTGPARRNP